MTEWIDYTGPSPSSPWHIVLVTDGEITCLAQWIQDPKEWYGEDLLDEDDEPIEEDMLDGHWAFFRGIGPFRGCDQSFGQMGDISHWMPLPNPPSSELPK